MRGVSAHDFRPQPAVSIERSLIVFAIVVVSPPIAWGLVDWVAGKTAFERALSGRLGEALFSTALAWKMLVYPHDRIYGSERRLSGAWAPATAILQWCVVGLATAVLARRRSLTIQIGLCALTVIAVGLLLLSVVHLCGLSAPIE